MELKEIEYFLAIVDEGGLTKAAQKLYITQPGLSRFLTKLEQSVGTPLFYRYGNNLSLSEAGEIYYENAKKIWEIRQNTLHRIKDTVNKDHQTLRVSLPGERCVRFAMQMLQKMSPETSSLLVQLMEGESTKIYDQVKRYEVDFGIIAVWEKDPELVYVPIREELIELVISPAHPFVQNGGLRLHGEGLDIADLKNELFVLQKSNTFMRTLCDLYFKQQNFVPKSGFLVQSASASLEVVESGMAIGFCVEDQVPAGKNILKVPLKTPFYHRVALVYRRGEPLVGVKKRFVELVEENRALF